MKQTITDINVQIILDYQLYFGVEPPEDRISLIKHISKQSILYEIAALNCRLKLKGKNSFETQLKELNYFTKSHELFNKYVRVLDKYAKSKNTNPVIFNRQACLFAIEDIVNSDEMECGEDRVIKIEHWEAIVKYLLVVNYVIIQIKEETDNKDTSLELLNPKLLPFNELSIEIDPFFTLYRGYRLIDYFLRQPNFSIELKNYFHKTYGIEPQYFVLHLMHIFITKNTELSFFYLVQEEYKDVFDRLSKRVYNKDTYKLISVRKSPIVNVGERKYLIVDHIFLIEKAYSQFINDFWFDCIKSIKNENGEAKFNIQEYRREFGLFFEKYLSQILIKSFENYKHSKLLMFEQLEINTTKGKIEIADIYFRYGNKIILGQAKSGSIYDMEKYGGTVEQLYKNNRNKFFENFGVNQVVKSITQMNNHIQKLDSKFPKGHSYEVFPCIIVNEKLFQTPLMPHIFNNRFKELITNFAIKKVRVNSLTIIHISDLERLEDLLNKNPEEIWEFLKYNHRDKKNVPPFFNTINCRYVSRQCPPKILELFELLMSKYNSGIVEK